MRISSLSKLMIASVVLSQLSACAVVAVGAASAGAVGGIAIMADRRSPAVQAIDKGIELEAGSALSKRFGDNAHINVTSFNQKVLLTGEAKDADIKAQAGAYAKAMKNARSVFNEIIIGPNSTFTARANDSFLESKVKAQMIFTDKLPSNSMSLIAEGSSIYLMGMLTQNEAAIAKKVASTTNGVKEVFAYFDIISEQEKLRLEKQGKADESQPSTAPLQ
ncbi:BON domain-containing protein [Polynucleobacter antarcticus]|uniref:Transporter n=1 Tax=Polynucleobacter antarcticus TaxID=1743162 RepID=A0A6M9PXQ8_9BURK|nr:BON domain-containing protein [Polynucleobacter antarcticus]QKM63545.1 transporter [Polynucleobacter antarcticus]